MENGEFKSADLKKGMNVILVTVWNHQHHSERRLSKGETSIPNDSYRLEDVTIHSSGKKQIYLMNESGMKGRTYFVKQEEVGVKYYHSWFFALTREDAIKVIESIRSTDEHKTETYQVV